MLMKLLLHTYHRLSCDTYMYITRMHNVLSVGGTNYNNVLYISLATVHCTGIWQFDKHNSYALTDDFRNKWKPSRAIDTFRGEQR